MPLTVPPRLRRAWARSSRFLPAATGAVTSVALATSLHQPVLLLGALSALVLVGPGPSAAGSPAQAAPDDATRRCPDDVRLGDLGVPPPSPAAIARAWAGRATGSPTLTAPLGAGPDGVPVTVDLVRDGPHLLVAGTTGSGKSELLTSLVLGLALTYPPDRLVVLLVDFKGGTGLPALTRLPHLVGHLSDLDAAGARRTLRGLFAELRRRERILAAHGVTDLRDLDPDDPGTPPRLLVVVDEFRVLADELPDLLGGLARLAAQGRSLGVHLVLATQRPSGAVPPDLRANVALRLVLRVADPADSADLVGVGDAACFDRPGLALLVRSGGRPEPLQVARATPRRVRPGPPPPSGDTPRRSHRRTPDAPLGWTPAPPTPPTWPASPSRDDGPAAWVAAARAAAAGRPRTIEPWLPPLPDTVTIADVPPGPGLPLALADLPDELSRGAVRWDPDDGHLLVLGGPGSGRSTTLAAIASAALTDGRDVHAVGVPPALLPATTASVLAADDVTRVARLVRLLAKSCAVPRPVLLVDDVAAVLSGLAGVARGAAAEAFEQLWASAGGPVAVVAAGAAGSATARLVPWFAARLVLGSPDAAADQLVGVPADLAGARPQPGRAVHVGRHRAALCQVALPSEPRALATLPACPPRPRVRVVPLPDQVGAASLPAPVPGGPLVAVGVGGDDAGPVRVDLARPLLVVGPPGSGRTTALATIAAGAAAAGLRVVHGVTAAFDEGTLFVVDDLDDLEARDPAAADTLATLVAAGHRAVVASTTAHAAAAFRGPVPALVRTRRLLVLDLTEPGSVDLLGPEGGWLVDPRRHPPGRGALRLGRDVVPLQVAAATAGSSCGPGPSTRRPPG